MYIYMLLASYVSNMGAGSIGRLPQRKGGWWAGPGLADNNNNNYY